MQPLNLKGLGVALVTPFKRDESIDYIALEKIIKHIVEGEADYLVVLGTTAETPTLTLSEKERIARFIYEKSEDKIPLVLGIGGNNTAGVVNDVKTRNLTGYSAILSVAPFYNKPTQEGLYYHFLNIAEASPIPIILYNVPGRTGVNLTAKTTLRLAHESEKIIGIKEASGNLQQCREIIEGSPAGFSLISGNDSDTASIIEMGGKGVISVLGNAFPRVMKKLIEISTKDMEEAKAYQKSLNPLIGHLFEDGNPAGVKAILSKMGLLENVLRLPLTPVSKGLEEKIEKEIAEFK